MIINLLSPLKLRMYTAYDYFEQIKRIIRLNPEITFNWIVFDNSRGQQIKRIIDDTGIPCTYLKDEEGAINNYEYKDRCDELSKIVARIDNEMVKSMPPCDYALLIEDDIVCKTENPIPCLLAGFSEGIGAVSACVFNKRLTEQFGIIQAMRRGQDKFLDVPFQETGYTPVIGTSFGFIMFKSELLKEPFMHNYKGLNKSVDISYGLWLEDQGLFINYAWEIEIWHYYKTNQGIVGYAHKGNRKLGKSEINDTPLKRVQLDCKASPMFVEIPTTMTNEEVYKKYKYNIL